MWPDALAPSLSIDIFSMVEKRRIPVCYAQIIITAKGNLILGLTSAAVENVPDRRGPPSGQEKLKKTEIIGTIPGKGSPRKVAPFLSAGYRA